MKKIEKNNLDNKVKSKITHDIYQIMPDTNLFYETVTSSLPSTETIKSSLPSTVIFSSLPLENYYNNCYNYVWNPLCEVTKYCWNSDYNPIKNITSKDVITSVKDLGNFSSKPSELCLSIFTEDIENFEKHFKILEDYLANKDKIEGFKEVKTFTTFKQYSSDGVVIKRNEKGCHFKYENGRGFVKAIKKTPDGKVEQYLGEFDITKK